MPPAPGLLSMMIGWPRFFAIAAATIRVTTSVALPGVKGTMTRIGSSGQVSAAAGWQMGKSASTAAIAKTIKQFMTGSSKTRG